MEEKSPKNPQKVALKKIKNNCDDISFNTIICENTVLLHTIKNPKKVAEFFCCEKCDYITSRQTNYLKHLSTRKHKNPKKVAKVASKLDFFTEKKEKIENNQTYCFICLHCNYSTNNKKDYNKHILTEKHKKKCNILESEQIEDSNISSSIILEVMKQNKELNRLLLEQNNKIMELSQKDNIINTNSNNITNITNNNTRFNINLFLNEKCKDAINMSDFLDSLKIDFEDLEYVGKNGYVEGITNIFMKNLNELDLYKRPIHCTDKKREVFYIKDENVWEKDNEEQVKIKKIIGKVAHKNLCMVSPWQNAHPECAILDSNAYNLHINIMKQSLNGGGNEISKRNDGRIIKNLASNVYIEKI